MGLPTAGILTAELQSSIDSTRSMSKSLSWIIQKLSVFVSHLDSVSEEEVNFELCQQGSRIIAKILDNVLSDNPEKLAIPQLPADGSLCDSNLDLGNSDDLMSWFDLNHWGQDSWLSFVESS